jgi:hypothetical protein
VSFSDATRTSVFALFEEFVDAIPETEDERLRRRLSAEHSRIDKQHPPTVFRLQFLSAHPMESEAVTRSAAEWKEIDAELNASRTRDFKASHVGLLWRAIAVADMSELPDALTS